MVTKSTATTKAKKESAQRKEAPLNTMEKFFGHTKPCVPDNPEEQGGQSQ
jgi:hypothetical protein